MGIKKLLKIHSLHAQVAVHFLKKTPPLLHLKPLNERKSVCDWMCCKQINLSIIILSNPNEMKIELIVLYFSLRTSHKKKKITNFGTYCHNSLCCNCYLRILYLLL